MTKLSQFTRLAQELVDASSALLGNRTINIMDLDGTIIASSEKNRIGTHHAGAEYVAAHGEELAITKENVQKYPGAKEGCNMPLVCNGEMIGVIGMFGNPSEVQELATLMRLYAVKYFELESQISETFQDAATKDSIFAMLANPGSADETEKLKALLEEAKIQFRFPMLCVRIAKSSGHAGSIGNQWGLELLEQRLLADGALRKRRDLWNYEEDTLRIVKSLGDTDEEAFRRSLTALPESVGFPVRIYLSRQAESWGSLGEKYREALNMSRCMSGAYQDLAGVGCSAEYMLGLSSLEHAAYLDGYAARLKQEFKEDERELLLRTVSAYYRNNRSVSKTAEELFVHKNTVQYRVRRVMEALGLHKESSFVQEYFIRLILRRI